MSLRVVKGPFTYDQNGLYTIHNSDFMHDALFMKAHQQSGERTGFVYPAPWRMHVNCWAIRRALQECKGDIVECGTWLGTTALAGMIYSGFLKDNHGKKFFLVDSWEGVDEENIFDGESSAYVKSKKERYSGLYPEIEDRFRDKPNVVLVKGFVPEILPEVKSKLISYLHLDMNAAYPEIEALKYFWERLEQGAIVVLDDYGFSAHKIQKKALDELCEKLGTEVLSLPTGQGLIIKS